MAKIKSRFKVGDKVMIIIHPRGDNPGLRVGDTGIVVSIQPYTQQASFPQYKVGVSWNVVNDKDLFHDCDGDCKYGKGWYELPQNLAKFSKGVLALDKIKTIIKKQIGT